MTLTPMKVGLTALGLSLGLALPAHSLYDATLPVHAAETDDAPLSEAIVGDWR